jgi:hypothetical protein
VKARTVGGLRREYPGKTVFTLTVAAPGRKGDVVLLEGCVSGLAVRHAKRALDGGLKRAQREVAALDRQIMRAALAAAAKRGGQA